MARTFGKYSPSVPLGTTWEESLVLEDEDGVAVDLTGYDVVAQFFADVPARDELGGPATDPLLEVTTAGYHGSPPDYSVEGFTVPTPANGEIVMALSPADFWSLSPTNVKAKLYWSILLVNDSGYTIPVVSGRVTLTPNNTILT